MHDHQDTSLKIFIRIIENAIKNETITRMQGEILIQDAYHAYDKNPYKTPD